MEATAVIRVKTAASNINAQLRQHQLIFSPGLQTRANMEVWVWLPCHDTDTSGRSAVDDPAKEKHVFFLIDVSFVEVWEVGRERELRGPLGGM